MQAVSVSTRGLKNFLKPHKTVIYGCVEDFCWLMLIWLRHLFFQEALLCWRRSAKENPLRRSWNTAWRPRHQQASRRRYSMDVYSVYIYSFGVMYLYCDVPAYKIELYILFSTKKSIYLHKSITSD